MRVVLAVEAAAGLVASGTSPRPASAREGAVASDPGLFVRALWLAQHYGAARAIGPENDVATKGQLAKALQGDQALTRENTQGLFASAAFARLAGPDHRVDATEMEQALVAAAPASRGLLLPPVRAYADGLTTSLDMIGPRHQAAARQLAEWLAAGYRPGGERGVTAICTGNSRRSMLVAALGNMAAHYYGLPEVRFHSGGTTPSAFNPRTIAALQEAGFEIAATSREAPRGDPKVANPVYRVRWASGPRGQAEEFSKLYADAVNPQKGFAALMVCGEADGSCPVVSGAALRVSMPYLDPKIYDDGAYEAAKYRERRDDIGRFAMAALLLARATLAAGGKLPGQ